MAETIAAGDDDAAATADLWHHARRRAYSVAPREGDRIVDANTPHTPGVRYR